MNQIFSMESVSIVEKDAILRASTKNEKKDLKK